MSSSKTVLFYALVFMTCLSAVSSMAANDRPMIFGMNPIATELWGRDPLVYDPIEFQKMAAAGCASCRISLIWAQVEQVRGVRDWSYADRWVKYALDNNIDICMLVGATPTWALPKVNPDISAPETRYPCREDCLDDFNSFIYECGRRYRGRVEFWEYWNEPNGYGWHWDGGFNRAEEYTPWMVRAYKQIKLADPEARFSMGGMDGAGGPYFIGKVYLYGGKGYFDAVSTHPYESGRFNDPRLSDIRGYLDSMGQSQVDIWITEIGWRTKHEGEAVVAGHVKEYLDKLIADHPTVKIATYHTAIDFPGEDFGYGLMDKDLNPRAAYKVFQSYNKPARPVITKIAAKSISPSSIKIRYETNVPSRGLVMYGPTDTYGMVTAREAARARSHEQLLVGLSPNSTYHFRIRAGAVDYGDSFSPDRTFTTLSGDAVQIVSGPDVSDITESGAAITWTTDVAASGTVEFGPTFAYGSKAAHDGLSTTHTVRLTGLRRERNYQYRVVSSAKGYADGAKEGHAFSIPAEFGPFRNGGFEQEMSGWTPWSADSWGADGKVDHPGQVSVHINGTVRPPNPTCMEGVNRLTNEISGGSAAGGVYQTAGIVNGTYVVSGWIASACDGGKALIELRALNGWCTGGMPGGTVIGSLSQSAGWRFFAAPVTVTTGVLTICTRVSQYEGADEAAGYFDDIRVSLAFQSSIARWRCQPYHARLATDADKIVTIVTDANTFYAQDEDRGCGIMVRTLSPHDLQVGDRADVAGVRQDIEHEMALDLAAAKKVSSGPEPVPLAVADDDVGGGARELQAEVWKLYRPQKPRGVNLMAHMALLDGSAVLRNIGLLVKTHGVVTAVGPDYFYIHDPTSPEGNTPDQGDQPGKGVRVAYAHPGQEAECVKIGDVVSVTGVSSCAVKEWDLVRLIRTRKPEDIVILQK